MDILSAQLTLGQVLSVHNPRVFQHLNCGQALLRVHVQHLGHDILPRVQREEKCGVGLARDCPGEQNYHLEVILCILGQSLVYEYVNVLKVSTITDLAADRRFYSTGVSNIKWHT